jgi:hypothetical protein
LSIRAILFGGTGMVGEGVMHEALNDQDVESLLVVGRRSCEVSHPKLTELIITDFFSYASHRDTLRGYDACFFCLGVTSVGKSEEVYRHITYDLTMAAATTLSELNPGMVFCYVSGLGTDGSEQGRSMWARVKGKTENDLRKIPFKDFYAFRPGFIRPVRGYKHTLPPAKLLTPLYPLLKLVTPRFVCALEDVGKSMIEVSLNGDSAKIVDCAAIARIAARRASGEPGQ